MDMDVHYNTDLLTQEHIMTTLEEYIAELKTMQDHAADLEEWNMLQANIDELNMQYEDEDGNLQWL